MDLAEITLIVPTKDERENIIPFLESIPKDVKLIVVDASRDETADLVFRHRRVNTDIFKLQSNIPAARQAGSDLAKTPWLLFTDADMVFDPDFFIKLSSLEIPAGTGIVAGAKHSRGRHRLYYRFFSFGIGLLCAIGVGTATGSNMLVRKDALVEAGGFDEELPCNEDSLLAWRINRKGYKVKYCRNLRVYEKDHRRLDRGLIRKTMHSLLRCFFLFSGLYPRAWYWRDWGYWKENT